MARVPRKIAGLGASDMANAGAFDTYTGPAREITVDPVRGILALHDNATAGGKRLYSDALRPDNLGVSVQSYSDLLEEFAALPIGDENQVLSVGASNELVYRDIPTNYMLESNYGDAGLDVLDMPLKVDIENYLQYNMTLRPRDFAVGLGFLPDDLHQGNALRDTAALQAFYDYISINNVKYADHAGLWSVNADLNIGPVAGSIATRTLYGNAKFTATAPIANMITLRNASWLDIKDEMNLKGTGSTSYVSRTCDNAIRVINSGRMRLPMVYIESFRGFGFVQQWLATHNNNLNRINKIFTRYMGSGAGGVMSQGALSNPDYAMDLIATFSGRSDPVTADNSTQRTRLTGVSDFPPAAVLAEMTTGLVGIFVEVDGRLRNVVAYDVGAQTVDLYPRLTPFAKTSGNLLWVVGGCWHASGSDSNNLLIDNLDAQLCGVVHGDYALYGATVSSQTTTTSKVIWGYGRSVASASLGGEHIGSYVETDSQYTTVNISDATSFSLFRSILSSKTPIDLAKFVNLGKPIANATEKPVVGSTSWAGFSFVYNGTNLTYEKSPLNGSETFSAITVDMNTPGVSSYKIAAAKNITIIPPAAGMNAVTGRDSKSLKITGNGGNNAPGGAITFNAPTYGPIVPPVSLVAAIVLPGSGGTPGKYRLGFSISGGAKGTFTVDGSGGVTEIDIFEYGIFTSVPTLIFNRCPGLTGATGVVTLTPCTVSTSVTPGTSTYVAGTSSIVFTQFNGPADFDLYYQAANNNILISLISGNLQEVAFPLVDAATIAVNLKNHSQFTVTIAGNRTMGAPTNLTTAIGQRVSFIITNAGTHTLAWNAAYKWPAGAAPVLTATAGRYDVFHGIVNQAGTAILMEVGGQNYS